MCPKCGVIATNPIPLLALGAAFAPTAIDAVKGLVTKRGKVKSQREDVPEKVQTCKHARKGVFEKAIMLEALER